MLRVATWNCQHGRPEPGKIGDAVALLDVDVLAMQEVDRDTERVGHLDLARSAADAFGGELVWGPALPMRGGGEYGNALLVRGEVRDTEVLALPGRRRPPGNEPRVAVLVDAVAAGRPWTIAATHLSTDTDSAVRQLLFLLDALSARPAPRVLLGDLNLPPQWVLPWLTVESYHMVVGVLTHPASRPRRQIDHVAVAGRGCRVDAIDALQLPVGDHRALIAEITCSR